VRVNGRCYRVSLESRRKIRSDSIEQRSLSCNISLYHGVAGNRGGMAPLPLSHCRFSPELVKVLNLLCIEVVIRACLYTLYMVYRPMIRPILFCDRKNGITVIFTPPVSVFLGLSIISRLPRKRPTNLCAWARSKLSIIICDINGYFY